MNITYRTNKIQRLLNSKAKLEKAFDNNVARRLMTGRELLEASPTLADVPPGPPYRRHQLGQDRDEQFAIDATKNSGVRIVFVPDHDPVPRKVDGGIDLDKVTNIKIIEVGNVYH